VAWPLLDDARARAMAAPQRPSLRHQCCAAPSLRCSHHCTVAALSFAYAFCVVAASTLSMPIGMFDGLGMFGSNLFKFSQISFKFTGDTGPNIPNFLNFVQFDRLRIFAANESQNLEWTWLLWEDGVVDAAAVGGRCRESGRDVLDDAQTNELGSGIG
jgi:hypothetical protein